MVWVGLALNRQGYYCSERMSSPDKIAFLKDGSRPKTSLWIAIYHELLL